MYDAISLFFTTIFKKVTPEYMGDIKGLIDLDYLLNLPYPASLTDQKYIGDIVEESGNVKNILSGFIDGY